MSGFEVLDILPLDPPDIASLTPRWILRGMIGAFIMALSGVFNLPYQVWMWWSVKALLLYVAGGAVLGWVGEKLARETK